MTEEKINFYITQALGELYSFEPNLISIKAEEESITAHLMCYLKKYFTSWSVDVEYNRAGKHTKDDSRGKCIFPDIIIHHRTPNQEKKYSPENNLVAMEVKGYWNSKDRQIDKVKLIDMKMRYGYQYLFRIELGKQMGQLIPVRV